MAKGYLVANIKITDEASYAEYRQHVPAVVDRFGGKFLVRAGKLEPQENGEAFERVVVIEFPSLDAARQFYGSKEYAPLLEQRIAASFSQVTLVEGA